MCFTCATYTDLSFLTTGEIPRVWPNNSKENIQAGYRNDLQIVNWHSVMQYCIPNELPVA